jgi:hypothetical protein
VTYAVVVALLKQLQEENDAGLRKEVSLTGVSVADEAIRHLNNTYQ